MPTAEIAALMATVLAVAGALSQLRRLVRTGDAAGVSLVNAVLGTVTELGRLGYTLHDPSGGRSGPGHRAASPRPPGASS